MRLNDGIEQLRRSALEPIRLHEEISRATRLASTRIVEVMRVNQQRWQHMIDQATAMSSMQATAALRMTDLTHTHRTWLCNLKPTQDQAAKLQIAVKLSLESIAARLAVSERLFTGVDVDAISRSIALPELEILRLQASVNDMTAIYGKMAESIRTYSDITHLPRFVLPGATREVFVTGYAVNVLGVSDEADAEQDSSEIQSVAELEEETSICISLLKAVSPDLARPYAGARDALRGTNPDRVRHFMSSQRELWNHLLRQISPDRQVMEWISGENEQLLHEGKPTRKARILYLCRDLNHGPLTNFIASDAQAFIKFVEFFSRVHQLNTELSDQQLRALQLRTDSWLTYILQVWKESQRLRSKGGELVSIEGVVKT